MSALLNHIRIGRKLAIILVVGFLIPIIILTALTMGQVRQQSERERMQVMQQTLEHIRSNMDNRLQDAFSLALALTTDTELNRYLDMTYDSPYDYLLAYQNHIETATRISPVYRVIDWVRIYTDNDTVISGSSVARSGVSGYDFGEKPDSMEVLNIPGQEIMLRLSTGRSLTRSTMDVSLICTMNALPQFTQHHRVLRLSLNLSFLESLLSSTAPLRQVLLVDPMDRILVRSDAVSSVGAQPDLFRAEDLTGNLSSISIPLDDIPNLHLVGVYERGYVSGEYDRIGLRYLILSGMLILLGLGLSLYVARTMTGRIRAIGGQASRIAQGDFSQMDTGDMGSDEIGVLAEDINHMGSRLQVYMDREYAARLRHTRLQREKARAELNALQSQVNPHFMFNALEAIRLKAKIRGENETARMISYMARTIRRLLEWKDDLIPLGEELDFIHEFLEIQRYRYDNDFIFTVEADESLLQAYIPKMMIQPLVENACVHGLRSATERREGSLKIRQSPEGMLVEVTDHGEGMTGEKLEEVRRLLREGDNRMHSVGLNNVQRRCRLYYGEAARLDADALEDGGSVFTLVLPVFWKKEDFHVPDSDRG